MADSSFDIFSKIDTQEIINAINQANKEWTCRYDLKNTQSNIAFNTKDTAILITSNNTYTLGAVADILKAKCVKRAIPLKALFFEEPKETPSSHASQQITIQQGIPKEKAKTIVKDIKDIGLKVQSQIMEDQVRVSAKKKDTLQEIMAYIKEKDYGIHIAFGNYR